MASQLDSAGTEGGIHRDYAVFHKSPTFTLTRGSALTTSIDTNSGRFHSLAPTLLCAAAAWALVSTACKGGDDKAQPSGKAQSGKTPSTAEPPTPSARTDHHPYRILLDESARAELDVGGLLVDFGTADQYKYTRGNWKTGWGESTNDKGISFAAVKSRNGVLDIVVTDKAVAEVVTRVRSAVAKQVLTIYVDGARVGDAPVTAEWSNVRIPATGLEPGRHRVELVFTAKGEVRAEVDWLWLSREAGGTEPLVVPRVIPIRVGERPKRALVAPTSRDYSFLMQPPANATLIADFGANVESQFAVLADTADGQTHELFSAKGENKWQEAVVDLSKFANTPIRLRLRTTGSEGVAGWGEPEIMVADAPVVGDTAKRPKNVIVILIDTVRADVFAKFNPDNKVVTPAFDALADKSTVFVNAYNQENWTKPSVATTLSGTYPTTHDTKSDSAKLPDEVELISEYLKGNGFATAGFVANGYVSKKFGFERGWDVFKNYIRLEKPSEAEYVYGDALEWLKANRDKPHFLYIQTIDPHVVYRVEREYTKNYFDGDYKGPLGPSIIAEEQIALGKKKMKATERDLAWLKALYWGEVTYHDEHMGRFLAELETMGALDDTVLIVTNDHGEELGEHGRYGHGHSLYEELLRAPMLVHYPPMFPAQVRPEVVENVDVAPTIVDLLGLKPMQKADGTSLLPLIAGEAVQRPYYALSEFLSGKRAIRVGDYKMHYSAGPNVSIYQVTKDRTEAEDIANGNLIARRLLEVHRGEALAALDKRQRLQDISIKRQFKAGEADIDPELRKQLEALGYFGE